MGSESILSLDGRAITEALPFVQIKILEKSAQNVRVRRKAKKAFRIKRCGKNLIYLE